MASKEVIHAEIEILRGAKQIRDILEELERIARESGKEEILDNIPELGGLEL